jgi:hypothetical protein
VISDVANPLSEPLIDLARVDQITYSETADTVTGPRTFGSVGWHFVPSTPLDPPEAVYICDGHTRTLDAGLVPAAIQAQLTAGRHVFGYLMLDWTCHAEAVTTVRPNATTGSGMRFHFGLPTRLVNLAESLGITDHTAIGLSGGGWTTITWPDLRIRRRFSVSGSIPIYMRGAALTPPGESRGDQEQYDYWHYSRNGYLDLYIELAHNAETVLYYNFSDNCCFGDNQYDPASHARVSEFTYEEALADFASEVAAVVEGAGTGSFVVSLSTPGVVTHAILADQLTDIMSRMAQ